jgi:hypothetical protein
MSARFSIKAALSRERMFSTKESFRHFSMINTAAEDRLRRGKDWLDHAS